MAAPMGLRLLAHYYELSEAIVAKSALDSAGVCAFLHGFPMSTLVLHPWELIGYGGYRLMVCEEELEVAVAAIAEARASESPEGGTFVVRYFVALSLGLLVSTVVFGTVWWGAPWVIPIPIKSFAWRERTADTPASG